MRHLVDPKYRFLLDLSVNTLNERVKNIRTQVSLGLMNRKEAHNEINKISSVIMMKEVEALEASAIVAHQSGKIIGVRNH